MGKFTKKQIKNSHEFANTFFAELKKAGATPIECSLALSVAFIILYKRLGYSKQQIIEIIEEMGERYCPEPLGPIEE